MSTVVLCYWCHSDGASVLLYFTFIKLYWSVCIRKEERTKTIHYPQERTIKRGPLGPSSLFFLGDNGIVLSPFFVLKHEVKLYNQIVIGGQRNNMKWPLHDKWLLFCEMRQKRSACTMMLAYNHKIVWKTYQVWSLWGKALLSYPLHKVWKTDMIFDRDLWPIDLTINRDHLLIKDYLPIKFEASGAKHCWVIRCTRFERLTWPLTLTFDLLTRLSIGIIYSSRTIYLPSLKLLGQSVLELYAQGLRDWHDLWPWPLTYWPDYQ